MDKLIVWASNIRRKHEGLSLETEHLSPWDAVFENGNFSLDNRPVGIFKGERLITIGYLWGYPSVEKKKKEFALINTWLKGLYIADIEKDQTDKLFDQVDAEYYDAQNDVLIKFYKNERVLQFLGDNDCFS